MEASATAFFLNTGLTYEALTGKQKQSVPHCEQVFSKGVLEFMQRNGHTSEAHFVETVRNWHKAADGRGLSEETRSKYNNDMINFLLTDWMPWHEYERDFSTIDVMRPIKGIKGFTREIVKALNSVEQSIKREVCPRSTHVQAAQMTLKASLHISMINLEMCLTTRNF